MIDNPRPYDVSVYYTVKEGCEDCKTILGEFKSVAYSYINAENPPETPCFFAVLYYNADPKVREIYTQHNFKTVPYLAVSKNKIKRDPAMTSFYDTPDVWLIKRDEASDSQMLIKFVNNRLGNDLPIKVPLYKIVINTLLMLVCLVGLITMVFQMRPALVQPALWFVISLLSYGICLSGIIYSLSHNNPFFQFSQNEFGKMYVSEYFMRSQRAQYGGEGLIVSAISVLVGCAFIAIVKIPIWFKSRNAMRLAMVFGCLFAFMAMNAYVACYRIKSPWYSNNFLPPKSFTKGPMWRDQGNNI